MTVPMLKRQTQSESMLTMTLMNMMMGVIVNMMLIMNIIINIMMMITTIVSHAASSNRTFSKTRTSQTKTLFFSKPSFWSF